MKTLDRSLARAVAMLRDVSATGAPRITYYSPTSWSVEADVYEYAPRGHRTLTVLGMGKSLGGAVSAFGQALQQAHTRHAEKTARRRAIERAAKRRGGGA